MPYITHPNGQKTYYEDDNFADPWKPHETILIQHGYARHSAFWYHWIPVLARHYRVIRRDARGHGRSSAPGKEYQYNVDTVLSEIVDTFDQLGLKKVHFLGESTGGIWGEFLAARHPERLHSLTICSSPLYMPESAGELLAFGRGTPWAAFRELGSRGWAERVIEPLGNAALGEDYIRWWIDQVSVSSGDSLADHGELLWDKSFDARTVMNEIRVPMLLLTPANSQLVDLDQQQQLHAAVPGSRMEIIMGAGHEIYIDQAEQCQQKHLDFLRNIPKS